MISVPSRRLILTDRLVFFPSLTEVRDVVDTLRLNDVVRIRQSWVEIPQGSPCLVSRNVFRTSRIDLAQGLDRVYGDMDPKSCRYRIRKAEKLGPRLQIRQNDQLAYRDFWTLHNAFVRAKGHTLPLSWRRLEQYLPVSDVFVAYVDDQPMVGHLLVRDDQVRCAREIFSATTRLRSPEDARLSGSVNRFLHWHQMQSYHAAGITEYDFGGIGDGTSSVAQFKLSFGGKRVEDHSYVLAGTLGRAGLFAFKGLQSLLRRHGW